MLADTDVQGSDGAANICVTTLIALDFVYTSCRVTCFCFLDWAVFKTAVRLFIRAPENVSQSSRFVVCSYRQVVLADHLVYLAVELVRDIWQF